MATYSEDITLLAIAQVVPSTDFSESLLLAAGASISLDEDIGAVNSINLLSAASVTVQFFHAHQLDLSLQSYAQVTIFDESLGAQDLQLDASAQILIDVETLGLEAELMLLALADITLDAEVQTVPQIRTTGGTFGIAPPVRIRQDTAPSLTPTPTRRRTFPTQG